MHEELGTKNNAPSTKEPPKTMEPNGDKTKTKVPLLTWIMLIAILIQAVGGLLNAVNVGRLQDQVADLEQKVTSLAHQAGPAVTANAPPGAVAKVEPR